MSEVQPFPAEQEGTMSVTAQTEMAKAVQEIQAALVIAKKFPRDEAAAFNKIVKACQRPTLAEDALYAYQRGNELVTGPSIRLAEAMAQSWGNLSFGVRELEQRNGESLAQAFCWDMETNTRQVKEFTVPHKRYTKNGTYALKDPRDIYELVANNGARRLRACILGIIPGDIVDAAVKEVNKTLAGGKEPIGERVAKILEAFKPFNIGAEHIEKRFGHKIEAITEAEFVTLKALHRTIKDGFASAAQLFDLPGEKQEAGKAAAVNDLLNSKQETVAGAPGFQDAIAAVSRGDIEAARDLMQQLTDGERAHIEAAIKNREANPK